MLLIFAIWLAAGCSKPPYVGIWHWEGKPGANTDGVILEIKNDGTFSASLSGTMNDSHLGNAQVIYPFHHEANFHRAGR